MKIFGFIKFLFNKDTPFYCVMPICYILCCIWDRLKGFLYSPCLAINKLKEIYKEYEYYLKYKDQ